MYNYSGLEITRKQFVSYNKLDSELMIVTVFLKDQHALGPLLFIYYINDIVKTTNIFNFILSADDTNMFHSHTNFTRLIEEVNWEHNEISPWFHSNKFSLNINKNNVIIFTPENKKIQ